MAQVETPVASVVRQNDIFISYSRRDKEFVRALDAAFRKSDRDPWIDWDDIKQGEEWRPAIARGIEAADVFVFVISPDSVASEECGKELAHAIKHNKRLIPIVRRETTGVHPVLGALNWIFFQETNDFEQAFQSLLKTIDTDLIYVRAHTRLLVRAIEWDTKDHNESYLLRGRDLEEAEQWLTQTIAKEPKPTELQQAYITTSRQAETAQREAEIQRQQAEIQRQKRWLGIVSVVSVVAVISAISASLFYRDALNQQRRAEAAQQQAVESQIEALTALSKANLLTNDQLGALLASVKAVKSLQNLSATDTTAGLRSRAVESLQNAVYTVQERNRLADHTAGINQVQFSADGKLMASASGDRTVKLWSAEGRLLKTLEGHTDIVSGVSISPDGETIASASKDTTVRLWHRDGRLLRTLTGPEGHQKWVNSVAFSSDGSLLASASDDQTVKLWSPTGELLATLRHRSRVIDVSFSPDGTLMASAGDDGTIRIWQVQQRSATFLHLLSDHTSSVRSVQFSADSQMLASGSYDQTVRLWNREGKLLKTIEHGALVSDVAFSPDGQAIASVGSDKTLKLWHVDGTLLNVLRGHSNWIRSVSFSPKNQMGLLVTGSEDRTLRVWNAQNDNLARIFPGQTSLVRSVSYSPDGQIIAASQDDGTIRLWRLDGRPMPVLEKQPIRINSVSFSPDSRLLASGSWNGAIKLWNLQDGTAKQLTDEATSVRSVSFSPNGQLLAVAQGDGIVKLWDVPTGRLAQTLEGHQAPVNQVVFSRDGQMIASASEDKTLQVWRIDGTRLQKFEGHGDTVRAASFSPDGTMLASASEDKTVNLWSLQTGTLLRTFKDHSDWVNDVSFSPDGQTIAAASADETIRIWQLDGTLLKTLQGHQGDVLSLSFSPNGQNLLSGSADKTLRIWKTKTFSVDQLEAQGCAHLKDYLSNPEQVTEKDQTLCQSSDKS